MGTAIEIGLPAEEQADALALLVAEPPESLGGDGARTVDGKLGGKLTQLGRERRAARRARRGARAARRTASSQAPRVVAAGIGQRGRVDLDALRTAAAAAAQALARVGGTICWLLDETLRIPLPDQARALVEGTIIGGYDAGPLEGGRRAAGAPFERIVIGHDETPELRAAAERAGLLAERTNRARELANMPPNELNPARARRAGRGARRRARAPHVAGARPARAGPARDGRARRRRPRQPQRAAPDRPPLRPAAAHARAEVRARARRQGDHVRHGRDLAQAGRRRCRT